MSAAYHGIQASVVRRSQQPYFDPEIEATSGVPSSMQDTVKRPQLTLSPTVAHDPATGTYAAWCDELAVATSALTEEEARDALLNAMRLAAEYVLGNVASARSHLLASVPYAEAIAARSDEELKALIHADA